MSAESQIRALLQEGVADRIFPAAQAAVFHHGSLALSTAAGDADASTRFDLGSLTKICCTATAFVTLWAEGKLAPDTPLSRFFPRSPASQAGVTLADLLYHRSGLPAFVPYFAKVMPAVPALFDPRCPAAVRMDVRTNIVDAASQQPLRRPPRTAAVYSDVGFILLGEILSDAASETLELLHEDRVASRLELDLHFRRLSQHTGDPPADHAPTGSLRPREHAPGQEGLWPPFPAPKASRAGEVDDDNAWVMDGVAGHAGLFGTAQELARFGHKILEELDGAGRLAPASCWETALRADDSIPGSTRALGYDTPFQTGSSAGSLLGKPGPCFGHLGFTGVSLWVDLRRRMSVALCTNRTYFGRADVRIKDFRPRFHDLVVTALGG
ncbi:MAG TPA: serine hydrolase domain-containing protein [Myxococcales bacterium]|nr:serine hydrolase domain-containing protein [Myxococcales bacterium]